MLALAVCVCTWFVAVRAPLWLDETVSFFLIKGGFAGIMSRQAWPDAPAYSYLLWLWTKVLGTAEITLRISSILPMVGAVYVLYCSARRLFEWDLAIIATIIFCLHPIIVFASIDVRPYAFAALAINLSILALISLRHNDSTWLAAIFGLAAACIIQFQLLFAVILPALFICFLALKIGKGKSFWRQLGVASAGFALAFLPAIRRLQTMYRTSSSHVFANAPRLPQLCSTLAVRGSAVMLIIGVLIALRTRRLTFISLSDRWTILLCVSLALVPAVIAKMRFSDPSVLTFIWNPDWYMGESGYSLPGDEGKERMNATSACRSVDFMLVSGMPPCRMRSVWWAREVLEHISRQDRGCAGQARGCHGTA
jgi:4-amino-4-deoxy-L-arabinose transferase-like glycosyltransferase